MLASTLATDPIWKRASRGMSREFALDDEWPAQIRMRSVAVWISRVMAGTRFLCRTRETSASTSFVRAGSLFVDCITKVASLIGRPWLRTMCESEAVIKHDGEFQTATGRGSICG